jgi:hypothetical protein
MSKLKVLFLVLSLLLLVVSAQAATWYSPLTAVAVGPTGPATLISVAPDSPPEAIVVTATSTVIAGDEQWVQIGLPAGGQKVMKAVEICYDVNSVNPGSTYIDTVRLTRMTTPDSPVVLFESVTPLMSTDPVCERLGMSPRKIGGAITISLKVVFGDLADSIKIGGIKLVF